MQTLKRYLTYSIIILFPIMNLINITNDIKLNFALSDISLVLLGILWILDIKDFSFKRNYPYFWYFLGLFIILIISGFYNLNSEVKTTGINGIIIESIKFIINAAYLFVGYNTFKDKYELKDIIKLWIIGLWIFIIYGLYKQISTILSIPFISINQFFGDGTRFLGTITDPNAAALYLSISFYIVIWAKNYYYEDKPKRILLNITNILVFVCIILTMSRGGIIGFGVSLIFYMIFNIKNIIRKLYFLPILVIVILAGAIIDNIVLDGYIKNEIITRAQDVTQKKGMFNIRMNLTLSAIDMGMDNFIIGVGRGNYPLNSKEYIIERGGNWEKDGPQFYENMISHNTLAGIFAEMGVLGLIMFLSIFVILAFKILTYSNIDFNMQIILISIWGSVFIQSLSICLENTRGVWLFLGISLLLLNTNKIIMKKLRYR